MSQDGKTPGQAACEAFYGSFGTSIDWDEDQGAEHRAAWEAAVKAAIAAAFPPSVAELAAAIREREQLLAGRDQLRAGIAGPGHLEPCESPTCLGAQPLEVAGHG